MCITTALMVLWLGHCVVAAVTLVRILVRAFFQLFLAVGTIINMHILRISEPENVFYVIYQTRERVFHQDIQTPRSGLKKRGAAEFFNRLRGVWIPDETLVRVFDMASQTIHNSWRNSRQKFAKLYAN